MVDTGKTLVIRGSPFDEPERERHAALIVMRGAEIGRDYRLRRNPMVIGRGEKAEIRLHDDRASRQHARLEFGGSDDSHDPVYVLTDLGSTNGTFVDGAKVESTVLTNGAKIQIGDSILKFVVLDSIEAKFHAEVRDRISYDQLTGLLTKESLYVAFERELDRCLRYDLPMSVLMMDLDRFKSVNDTHGHLMGSHVLAEVGGIIRHCIRSEDVSARYGGEEFITYLAETGSEGARLCAERIRAAIEDHVFVLDDVSIRVTISIGTATAPGNGTSIKELVGRADEALYKAKETGRNRVCVS
ncbi:MAG: GGDEF domain-containing protein [Longimicrobiales bacterium]|nr:GGDEF domain-containing protein [Longimicrobiales bacterium]